MCRCKHCEYLHELMDVRVGERVIVRRKNLLAVTKKMKKNAFSPLPIMSIYQLLTRKINAVLTREPVHISEIYKYKYIYYLVMHSSHHTHTSIHTRACARARTCVCVCKYP